MEIIDYCCTWGTNMFILCIFLDVSRFRLDGECLSSYSRREVGLAVGCLQYVAESWLEMQVTVRLTRRPRVTTYQTKSFSSQIGGIAEGNHGGQKERREKGKGKEGEEGGSEAGRDRYAQTRCVLTSLRFGFGINWPLSYRRCSYHIQGRACQV